jgi:hypothetical protein
VVSSFEFRLHPVGPMVLGGLMAFPLDRGRAVLQAYRTWAAELPDEFTTMAAVITAPPAPFVPAELVGTRSVVVMFVWTGDPASGQAAIQPFREVATRLIDMAMPMPYPGIYQLTAEGERRAYAVHRSRFLDALDDDAVDAILDAAAAPSSPVAMVQLRVLGGAMARVPADATAFAHRDAPVMVTIITPYLDPATEPAQRAWTDGLYEALAAHDAGVYSNFLGAEGEEPPAEERPGGERGDTRAGRSGGGVPVPVGHGHVVGGPGAGLGVLEGQPRSPFDVRAERGGAGDSVLSDLRQPLPQPLPLRREPAGANARGSGRERLLQAGRTGAAVFG